MPRLSTSCARPRVTQARNHQHLQGCQLKMSNGNRGRDRKHHFPPPKCLYITTLSYPSLSAAMLLPTELEVCCHITYQMVVKKQQLTLPELSPLVRKSMHSWRRKCWHLSKESPNFTSTSMDVNSSYKQITSRGLDS